MATEMNLVLQDCGMDNDRLNLKTFTGDSGSFPVKSSSLEFHNVIIAFLRVVGSVRVNKSGFAVFKLTALS